MVAVDSGESADGEQVKPRGFLSGETILYKVMVDKWQYAFIKTHKTLQDIA